MPISMAQHISAPRRDNGAPPSYRSSAAPSQRGQLRPPGAQAGTPPASAARPGATSQRYVPRPRRDPSPARQPAASAAAEAATSYASCAQAIFYDDNPDNFRGITIRGKFPSIRPVHCPVPMTCAQLKQALGLLAAARLEPPDAKPTLFFFFDFDSTLSEQDGLELSHSETIADLFGSAERRKLMSTLLRTLLDLRRVYIVTANISVQRIADVLNELCVGAVGLEEYAGGAPAGAAGADGGLAAAAGGADRAGNEGGDGSEQPRAAPAAADISNQWGQWGDGATPVAAAADPSRQMKPRWFAVDDTVRYVPVGGKVRAIQQIVSGRGYTLKTVFK